MTKEFKINNFDLLRLFAATEVLLLHSFPRLDIPLPGFFKLMSNFPGVAMFFVMSGFLISSSLERNKDLKKYFINRCLRIYPGLIMCLCITVVVITCVTSISFLNAQSLPWFLSQCVGIIYTPSFLDSFGFGSYNGSLWTIPLELQFYLVLPILYFLLSKLPGGQKKQNIALLLVFISFCVISYIIRTRFTKSEFEVETLLQKLIRYSFLNNFFLFLFGVVLQRLRVFESNYIYGKGIFWVLFYLIINNVFPTNNDTVIFKLLLLGITTISLAYTLPTLSARLLKGNDVSYGVYIYHGLVLGVFVELQLFHQPLYVLAILVITFLLAALSWKFVERPFIKKKNAKSFSNPPSAPVVAVLQ